MFWITGSCVNCSLHLNQESCAEKSFHICVKYEGLGQCVPPVLEYTLSLVNHGDSMQNRKTTGSWDCLHQTEITWECILYADLMDPSENWIRNNYIKVAFAFKLHV